MLLQLGTKEEQKITCSMVNHKRNKKIMAGGCRLDMFHNVDILPLSQNRMPIVFR
jgi:hypothetical protein